MRYFVLFFKGSVVGVSKLFSEAYKHRQGEWTIKLFDGFDGGRSIAYGDKNGEWIEDGWKVVVDKGSISLDVGKEFDIIKKRAL